MYLLRLCEKKYGAEHPRSLASFDKLANLYEQLQQWERALPLRERLVILRERVHGQESRQKRESVNAVARLYELLNRYEQALPLRQYLLEVQEQIPHLRNAAANELADVYEKLGQFEQAQILRQSLPITDEAHHTQTGSTDSDMKRKHIAAADANVDLAQAYVYMGDLGGALEIYQEALETRQEILGSEHADTINIVRLMAEVHEKLGQWDMALPLRQRAWAVCEKLGKAALDKGADAATTTEYQNDSHRDALSDRAIAKANELIMRLAHDIEGRDYCAGYWKEYEIYPLAHHTVLGYLEYLWAGGESDEGFERRSLKKDFNMKGINVAALYYIVAKLRDIPFESVLHFLAPNSTGADESVPATFEKIMVIAPAMNEEGLSGEIKTLAGVVCGAYLDPNQIRYNAAQINDDFDSVGFIVKYCKALELLKQ
jgi:tetratricopeptide (TPR) repeat protein